MLRDGRGWLTLPGSKPSLEAALSEVLSNPESIAARGATSRDYVRQNYDDTRIGEQYLSLLLGSAGRNRGGEVV